MIKLLKIYQLAEDWLEVYENCPDYLSNNLRLNEISIFAFFQFYCKINRNQLLIFVKTTYDLHSDKYFEILILTFWGRNLVTRRFGFHSNSRGADEMKDFPVSIDFYNRNTECYSYLVLYLHNKIHSFLEILLLLKVSLKKSFSS